jgi:hypothetical protein
MRNLVIAAALTLGLVTLPAAAGAGESFQIGVKPSTTALKLGKTLTFTGHVRPVAAAAGHTVKLQEKYGPKKPWRTKDTDQVGNSGKYQLSYKPTTATVRKYRVLMPAIPHHARGLSKELTVSVYAWSTLTSHQYVNVHAFYPAPRIYINGTRYDDSLLAGSTGATSIEFNLNHLCTELRGTYGLSDTSETGAQATFGAEADGSQIYSKTFSLGESEFSHIKLDKPLKLRFAAQSTSTDVAGFGAVGTPEVFCTTAFGG